MTIGHGIGAIIGCWIGVAVGWQPVPYGLGATAAVVAMLTVAALQWAASR